MSVVLVTGASRGIGLATARLFHRRGWEVVAGMRSPDASLLPEGILVTHLDLLDGGSVRAAVAEAEERFGGLDVLVNNAAVAAFGPLGEMDMGRIEEMVAVNVLGTIDVTREALPLLRASRGTVVNLSSLLGRMGVPLMSTYVATKFAMEGLTEALDLELRPLGVRVRAVEPGLVDTGMMADAFHRAPAGDPYVDGVRETMMGKGIAPERVARAVLRAATARGHRMRYPVGPTSWAAVAGRKVLPHSLLEALVRMGTRG